jgi:hypothetical protein
MRTPVPRVQAPTPQSNFELSHGRAGVPRSTELPSTFDLAAGTAKATNHPPYYGGFIPASYRYESTRKTHLVSLCAAGLAQ